MLKSILPLRPAAAARRSAAARRRFHVGAGECTDAYIGGRWTKTADRFDVTNPADRKRVVASVANCTVAEARDAVAAANDAFHSWAHNTTARQRADVLHRLYELHVEHEDELTELITAENGKTLAEARAEVAYGGSYFAWYAGEARRIYGQVVPPATNDRLHLHLRQPAGVAAVITPWNFPNAMISRKLAAALAAGCTMVVKPAEDTPLSALALAHLCEVAGVPAGVLNVLPCDRRRAASVGRHLCESTAVDVLSFTGSTAVGKLLLRQSADTVKRVALELGGNAPFIVFESADVDVAVAAAMAAKFRCSGQTCVSASRFFVHAGVHDEFVRRLRRAMKANLVLGDGARPGVTQGPLINEQAVEKVHSLVRDAVDGGAALLLGGERSAASAAGCFYEPTLLTGVEHCMRVCAEEIFGPVVPVVKFESEQEVIGMANHTKAGLAGYVFTGDASQALRAARHLDVGMVAVNEGVMSCAEAAFGGVKESGMGREGGSQGIDEFTEWKYLCFGGLDTELKA